MNKSTIESIEWHKDQLFKLLEDNDLVKIEGDIHLVKTELNEIIEKAKKRVWVKPTATKKGFYREQEVGRKEGKDVNMAVFAEMAKKQKTLGFDLHKKGYTTPKEAEQSKRDMLNTGQYDQIKLMSVGDNYALFVKHRERSV